MDNKSLEKRKAAELTTAVEQAKYSVFKSHIYDLKDMAVLEPDEDITKLMKIEDCVRMLRIDKLTHQNGEDVHQKLTTVYNSVLATGAGLFVMIDAPDKSGNVDIYAGVRYYAFDNKKPIVANAIKTLDRGIKSNFPGSETSMISSNTSEETNITGLLKDIFSQKGVTVSAASTIASSRDKSKTENKGFIQGIERLIDAMRGQTYTAVFISDPVSTRERENIRYGMEKIYTALSPFEKSAWAYNENESLAVMNSISETTGSSVTEGTSWTQSHTISNTVGTTQGESSSVTHNEGESRSRGISNASGESRTQNAGGVIGSVLGIGGAVAGFLVGGGPMGAGLGAVLGNSVGGVMSGMGMNKNVSSTRSESIGETISNSMGLSSGRSHSEQSSSSSGNTSAQGGQKTKTMNTGKTTTDGTTSTTGSSRSLQIETHNKTVSEILGRIDTQLERLRESEDYGLYNCGAYFISKDEQTSVLAANTYRALMLGDNSSAESSAVNTWVEKQNGIVDKRVGVIKEYLGRMFQPVFAAKWDEDNFMPFSAGTMVSGLELPLHLGLPMSSVQGLDVVTHAAFGRNVKKADNGIKLGSIFHMGQAEKNAVELDINSLAAHTFVTGSTGSGKSNTIYKMLSGLTEKGRKFLVIESAKGEYKNVFGNRDDVSVYGTNPKLGAILRINPFSFPDDVHAYEHIDRLVEIFNVCWPMYAAMPAVLKDAIVRSYEGCGWDMKRSVFKLKDKGFILYPSFGDVLRQIDRVMNESQYSADSKGDYKGALSTRLRSLTTGINSMIFTPDEISAEKLFDENVIVDLSRIGSVETKSLIMGILVMKLQEHRMSTADGANADLKHVTVLEEAHNLLKRTSAEQFAESSNLIGKSVEMLANSIAEMRTYGEGFIIADQSPGLLDMAVIRNTNTKIILRLPDLSDRELVGRAAGLNDEQIVELSKLRRGVAAIYQNDWLEPVLCQADKYESDGGKYMGDPYVVTESTDDILSEIKDVLLARKRIEEMDEEKIYKSDLRSEIKWLILNSIFNGKSGDVFELSKIADTIYEVSDTVKCFNDCESIEDWKRTAADVINPSIRDYSDDEIKIILLLVLQNESLKNLESKMIFTKYQECLGRKVM